MNRHLPASLLLACCTLVAVPTLAAEPRALLVSDKTTTAVLSFFSGQAFVRDNAAAESASDDYTRGTQALDGQRWQDAITAFDRVAKAHDKRADAALYWKSYALNKLGRPSLVSATCSQLRTTYPRSTWNHDCSTLIAAAADPGIFAGGSGSNGNGALHPAPQPNDDGIYRGGPQHLPMNGDRMRELQNQLHGNPGPLPTTPEGAGSDADLKMLALNSVLQRDPSQALPMIRTILTGSGSPQLKQRALSTLGMSQSPDAQSLLRDVALGKIAPAEQRQAIQMLGAFQGKRAGDTLAEIYRTSPDRNIKRTALSGLFIAGDAPRMVDLARSEKDLQLKHDIVAQLALMHDKAATDYMLELLR